MIHLYSFASLRVHTHIHLEFNNSHELLGKSEGLDVSDFQVEFSSYLYVRAWWISCLCISSTCVQTHTRVCVLPWALRQHPKFNSNLLFGRETSGAFAWKFRWCPCEGVLAHVGVCFCGQGQAAH